MCDTTSGHAGDRDIRFETNVTIRLLSVTLRCHHGWYVRYSGNFKGRIRHVLCAMIWHRLIDPLSSAATQTTVEWHSSREVHASG